MTGRDDLVGVLGDFEFVVVAVPEKFKDPTKTVAILTTELASCDFEKLEVVSLEFEKNSFDVVVVVGTLAFENNSIRLSVAMGVGTLAFEINSVRLDVVIGVGTLVFDDSPVGLDVVGAVDNNSIELDDDVTNWNSLKVSTTITCDIVQRGPSVLDGNTAEFLEIEGLNGDRQEFAKIHALSTVTNTMGVKNLAPLLKRYAPDSLAQRNIDHYRNKRLAIDGSLFLRKFVYGLRVTDKNGLEHPYPHILGFYCMTLFLNENNIIPIYVFDGKTRLKEKRKEIARRKELMNKVIAGWNFEKTRNQRSEKWKDIADKMKKLDDVKSEYIKAGLKEVVHEALSQPPSQLAETRPIESESYKKIHVEGSAIQDADMKKTDYAKLFSVVSLDPFDHEIIQKITHFDHVKKKHPSFRPSQSEENLILIASEIIYSEWSQEERAKEWKFILDVAKNLNTHESGYVLSSIRDLGLLTNFLPLIRAVFTIESLPPSIEKTPVETDLLPSFGETVETDLLPSFGETVETDLLPSFGETVSTEKTTASIEIEKVIREEIVTSPPVTIDEPIMKTISKLDSDQTFREQHPDFIPTEDDIKLKRKVKEVVKSTFTDAASLVTDKTYTRSHREVAKAEYQLLDSLLTGQTPTELVSNFEFKSYELSKKLERRAVMVTWQMYDECQYFLKSWGKSCISPQGHEAEAFCMSLTEKGYTDAVVSDDMDTTIYGNGPVLRNFLARNRTFQEIMPDKARELLSLTVDQYIDLCILCGTDFAGTIRYIGPITALKMIREHEKIENILGNLKPNHIYTPNFMDEVQAARKLFKDLPSICDSYIRDLERKENSDSLKPLLERYHIDPNDERFDYDVVLFSNNKDG
ncbi:11071_t:CDS:2 [Acaulospora morrowiae]|uniref:11071_t:CDS:1 n=1 Tax=Acaulospora morrowiae TaxID=94023 RepID=A0A9N9DD24_9GLOM|nr:11071_t:CDS:2 [Acaulospora morrowiae]